jgi:hypothetical protein
MRALSPVFLALATLALSCTAATSSQKAPPDIPSAEEVRTFLSNVGQAATGNEKDLRRFFEGGSSYPQEDFAMVTSSEFWKLRPAARVKRLGPDAFHISFLPEQPPAQAGAMTVSVRVTLPVRRGKDGQLRVLSRTETERLEKLPVPEEPPGEVVALEYPDEGSFGRDAGSHYATELWAEAQGDQVRLSLRFDPTLTRPGLRADLPIKETFYSGEEMRLEVSFDADANGGTGFRMDDLYRRMQEIEKGVDYGRPQLIEQWQGLGVDKRLSLEGKKFVQSDGTRAWAVRATLRNVAPEAAGAGMIRDGGEVVFEKTLADREVKVDDDVLTLTIPAALLPMRAGGAYRFMLHNNGGSGVLLKARQGMVRVRGQGAQQDPAPRSKPA